MHIWFVSINSSPNVLSIVSTYISYQPYDGLPQVPWILLLDRWGIWGIERLKSFVIFLEVSLKDLAANSRDSNNSLRCFIFFKVSCNKKLEVRIPGLVRQIKDTAEDLGLCSPSSLLPPLELATCGCKVAASLLISSLPFQTGRRERSESKGISRGAQ